MYGSPKRDFAITTGSLSLNMTGVTRKLVKYIWLFVREIVLNFCLIIFHILSYSYINMPLFVLIMSLFYLLQYEKVQFLASDYQLQN